MQKVILAGNPNTGKTTLFNTITRSSEHAGNWHGVTVEVKEKGFSFNNNKYLLCDLPGIYSLDSYSKEEEISAEYIEKNKDAIVVCIVDANNLRRNLYLALELKERTNRLIIAVNMAKEVKGLNEVSLSKELGAWVVKIDARKKKSVSCLLEEIEKMQEKRVEPAPRRARAKAFSLQEFERESKFKFIVIDKILTKCGYNPQGYYGYSKLDKFMLNGFWAFVLFAIIMGAVFFITFGSVGSFLSSIIGRLFEVIESFIMQKLETFIVSEPLLRFIEEGVMGGALTVLTFMPQIVLLFLCLNLLEDIGYLSRVAFMFDGLFKKVGLTGRSAFSLIMGFGCTTTACLTTRNLDSKSLRNRTTLLLPYMSCSAKLPIYAVICSAFFDKYKPLIVLALYLFAILLMLIVSLVFKAAEKGKEQDTFMLEMPKYRFPNAKKIFKDALTSAKDFFVRVGGVLLISSMVVFLLYNFSFKLEYTIATGADSILESVAKVLSVIFVPLGFESVGAVVAIISGIVAKEMVVSSLAIINGTTVAGLAYTLNLASSNVHFTTLSAISFLVFVLLYTPCVSAVISMKKEIGLKNAMFSVVLQFLMAYFMSMLVYGLGKLFCTGLWFVALAIIVLLAIIVCVVVKYLIKKIKTKTIVCLCVCNGCKEKCHGDNKL